MKTKIYIGEITIGISIDKEEHVDKILYLLNENQVPKDYCTLGKCESIVIYCPRHSFNNEIDYCTYVLDNPSCDKLVTSTYFLENVNKTILFDGITK